MSRTSHTRDGIARAVGLLVLSYPLAKLCDMHAHSRTPLPSSLQILPTCVFNKKDPIVVGVDVKEGIARVGTPLAVPTKGGLELGRIASLELNHKVRLTAVWRVGTWQC